MRRYVLSAILAGLVFGGLVALIGVALMDMVRSYLPPGAAPNPPAERKAEAPRPSWLARKMKPPPRIELRPAEVPEPAPRVPEKPRRYFRVLVQDAGTLKSGKMTIRLADVQALSPDDTCQTEAGKRWPCGRRGQAALRRLIRTRSVMCAAVDRPAADLVVARCKVGRIDINDWVVRQGWARPSLEEGEQYAAAQDAAKKARRGQWRTAQ